MNDGNALSQPNDGNNPAPSQTAARRPRGHLRSLVIAVGTAGLLMVAMIVGAWFWAGLRIDGPLWQWPPPISAPATLHFTAIGGTPEDLKFWCFADRDDNFLFALAHTNPGRSPLYPGIQGEFSDELLFPHFMLGIYGTMLDISHDRHTQTVYIDGKAYDLRRGSVLILRQEDPGVSVEQLDAYDERHRLNVDQVFQRIEVGDVDENGWHVRSRPFPAPPDDWADIRVASLPQPSGTAAHGDRVLLNYRGRDYAVEDLTGVRYADAVAALRELGPLPAGSPTNIFTIASGTFPVDTTVETDPVDWYHHRLSGVVEIFVRGRVFDLFVERHPVDISRHYDEQALPAAIRQYGLLKDKWLSCQAQACREGWSPEELLDERERLFPGWGSAGTRSHDKLISHPKIYQLCQITTPYARDGEPVAWIEDWVRNNLLAYHIEAVIEADQRTYVRLVIRQHTAVTEHMTRLRPYQRQQIPGGPLHSAGKGHLLLPLLEEVLASLQVMPEANLRTWSYSRLGSIGSVGGYTPHMRVMYGVELVPVLK